MDNKPLVSVIIPAFNRANYLPDAIDSILNQGINNLEIMVVDDGSTDHTEQVLKKYGPKVRYLYQENQGPGAARNHGMREAGGEYIAFLDSDDLWKPGKLKAELTFFEQDSELEAIISDAEFFRDGKLELASRFAVSKMEPMPQTPTIFKWESRGWAYGGGVCATCCMILKRSVLSKMKQPWFETSISSYEDWYFEMQVYAHGRVLINPQILAKVRRFEDGTRKVRPSQGSGPYHAELLAGTRDQITAIQKFLLLQTLPDFATQLAGERHLELQEISQNLSAQLHKMKAE